MKLFKKNEMSKATLDAAKASHCYLLTRAPKHLKIVKAALEAADAPDAPWAEKISFVSAKEGATYRWLASEAEYEGHSLRLVVVESSALDKKKEHTLNKQREAERVRLEQAAKDLACSPFHCEADAKKAAEAFLNEQKSQFHGLAVQTLAQEVIRKKRGRPKQGETPQIETIYVRQIAVTPDEARFQEARRRASRFVLATTLPAQWRGEAMDGAAVLGYLFLFALTIYRVFQRRIRQHITEQKPMHGAGGRILRKPTAAAIFQIFKYLRVVTFRLPDGTRVRQFGSPLTKEQKRVLTSLGFDESLYLG
ncbi:hypothetical protein SAMN04487970_104130 [Paenibacillus tianmuensis]|uniref:Uncharacterized protein n=1 Tax=Paenibacillus tianmuensis TaxID=624147 RepID=A0A1G4T5K4_9BACL|nr:hypothetical protein [Paenibacillus tianmuensis]SCW75789.1 hypothetical protein SAMN04487970_104130 [Paenibacillus tianmuensis]